MGVKRKRTVRNHCPLIFAEYVEYIDGRFYCAIVKILPQLMVKTKIKKTLFYVIIFLEFSIIDFNILKFLYKVC